MEKTKQQIRKEILIFLAVTFGITAIMSVPIFITGSLDVQGGLFLLLIMWSPGTSSILLTPFLKDKTPKIAWNFPDVRYLLWGYLLPLAYAVPVYAIVWLTGLGGIDEKVFTLTNFAATATVVVSMAVLSALGEELGWRGFLVPRLAMLTDFTKTALISGAIWLVWHTPLILFANYNADGSPRWFSLLCFAVMIIGMSFVYTWLRMKSRSILPVVLLHAAHNAFIQNFFDAATVNTGPTPYLTGEFGVGLALMGIVVGMIFWWIGKKDFERKIAT